MEERKVVVTTVGTTVQHTITHNGKVWVFTTANGNEAEYSTISAMMRQHNGVDWSSSVLKHVEDLAKPTPPVRKLREVKGVTYRDGFWVDADGCKWEGASGVIWNNNLRNPRQKQEELTDADFPAIYALKDDPYEPVETVEVVLEEFANVTNWDKRGNMVSAIAARIRAAVIAETGGDADA